MSLTKLRAIIAATITILSAILSLLPVDAKAAQATLMHCGTGTSVTGQFIYIGTYQVMGRTFQMTFTSWCPYTVEVQ